MRYTVAPGLYALGSPDAGSPVLVTANYKLTFDRLRRAIDGVAAWILVLDTNGINVWCAAGKGTFGTEELAHRVAETCLDLVVDHRELIVPQLGAPGVAAHLVSRRIGFDVIWGPVMAEDLPAFLANGRQATPKMRRKHFPLRERAELIPMELVPAARVLIPIVALIAVVGFSAGGQDSQLREITAIGAAALLAGLAAGSIATPLMLSWLPGRAFSFKGMVAGAAVTAAVLLWRAGGEVTPLVAPEALAGLLIGAALSAFLAMNFTGSSTYTSLSGVRKEMRIAVPLQVVAAVLGFALLIGSFWLPGGAG